MKRISTLIAAAALLAAGIVTAGGTEPVRYKEGKGVTEPVVIQKVAPVYPPEAKAEKVQGVVVMETTIDTEGKVTDVRVVKSDDERLVKAAVDAVRQWTYKPARDAKGKAVAVIFTVTVRFALH